MAEAPVHVVLLGLMGAGKSSIGQRVAERLDRPLLDGDEVLEARTGGRTAADVAEEEGLDSLHVREAQVAIELLATPDPAVIGPAASVVEVAAAREALLPHVVVWLRASAGHHAAKAAEKPHRPLLAGTDLLALFEAQLAARGPRLEALAELVVDIESGTRDEHADAIADYVMRR